MAQHNDTGKWGEELAADFLRKNGYQIMERNWRFGHRDLDIIARSPEGNEVVFVEVKTRSGDIITKPEDAVDVRKIRSIGYCANAFVKQFNIADLLRFDIVGRNKDEAEIEHVKDAFNPCLVY